MRLLLSQVALLGSLGLGAQAQATRPDTVATRAQVLETTCALFPAAARLPNVLPKAQQRAARFTPTAAQALVAEQALGQVNLLNVNSGRKSGQDSAYACAISQRLGQYYRQYYGFYNQRRQPCLFINFLGDVAFTGEEIGLRPRPPGYVPYWLRQYVFIGDGGDNHWSIYYNLATGQFSQYWHNLDLGGG
ncbi:hypothetical protein HHL22_06215 [Hymenobacter sp. RP-2-7]|uniref:Uncharacterized protein n=1 Tax=Hymenobacter polaris TaxID=2682546 RepID=A0A7Y0ACG7_9BACT|nr:hypothetical protein [Hymenobacter polaris]NML64795.1 hypothetical protein [Hymenobacter polaris]